MIETTRKLSALSEEFVEVAFRHEPAAATQAGIHDYDHELPDHSREGFQRQLVWLRDFDGRLTAGVRAEDLPPAQQVDHALLRSRVGSMRHSLEQLQEHRRNPVRYSETALQGVFLLLARPFAPLEERKESILARLMAIPDYLDSARSNLDRVPGEFVEIASEVNLAAPAFVDEVMRALLRSFPGEAERIEHAGARARLGFLRYQEFLDRTVATGPDAELGIGELAMNEKLAREHLLALDCAALESLGREHVQRTVRLLEEAARRIDPSRTWREVVDDARRRRPEASKLRETYVAETERARRFAEEKRIAPIPAGPLEIIDTPAFYRPLTPYAAYLPPGPFDEDQTGNFYVTPIDLSRPRAEQLEQLGGHNLPGLPLAVVHEAYPGHHLQALHANRACSRLRQLAQSPLFAEGWALYCEDMMHEEGFFKDPVTRVLQLRDLLWRACRVVIDVRLHTGRMAFGPAVDYLVEQAMLERVNAEKEVRWYALRPTHPMSYLVGKLEILAIREEARRLMGARFNLHDFHTALLAGGTLPPALARDDLSRRLGAS